MLNTKFMVLFVANTGTHIQLQCFLIFVRIECIYMYVYVCVRLHTYIHIDITWVILIHGKSAYSTQNMCYSQLSTVQHDL